ncbi:MAG: DUF551 domain-containing protein [Oscillibacter sp.]|uniref:DUF551 domain-containing protein n=1 Tax=Oscillibacter sp. TaxID=1945593 RepID=UPI0013290706|nr:DUF551 domain-containing protein [Oscillibacter sp.]
MGLWLCRGREISRSSTRGSPTLTPPNEWVSVEERLPTDERPVLVFVGYADTMTGFITTSSYFCFDANPHWQWDGLVQDEQKTLFWMPLPEPPGKEGEDGQETGCNDFEAEDHHPW